jgi:hypothetical protein
MNPLVAPLARVALFKIRIAVCAHVCLKSLNIQWSHHFHMNLLAPILVMEEFVDTT